MPNRLFCLLISLLSIGISKAQDAKKVYLDLYWGGPQITPAIINNNLSNVNAKGLGPFGARADFFLSDRHT